MNNDKREFGGPGHNRPLWKALQRGLRKNCPQCGRGSLFRSYVKTCDECTVCKLNIAGHQADDAPPYVTMLIVGHLAIPLALASKQLFDPPLWQQFAVWLPIMIAATAWLLPISKGGLIGLQWANRMHGFGDSDAELELRG